jgi:putative transposase
VVPDVRGDFARTLCRRRPKPGDTWHMDKVYLRIDGELHDLWRAMDQHGVVLEYWCRTGRKPPWINASSGVCSLV